MKIKEKSDREWPILQNFSSWEWISAKVLLVERLRISGIKAQALFVELGLTFWGLGSLKAKLL